MISLLSDFLLRFLQKEDPLRVCQFSQEFLFQRLLYPSILADIVCVLLKECKKTRLSIKLFINLWLRKDYILAWGIYQPGKNSMSYEIKSSILDNQGRGEVGDFLKNKIQVGSKLYIAYCQHCRVVTNQSVIVIPCLITETDGEEKLSFSRTYHCETCGLFVRSVEDDLAWP